MATKIKGIYKSFKYISQFFVVKERDMEIGYPTDVKHVAHIGWDGPSGSGPSWMNEFRTAPDFSTSIGSLATEHKDPNHVPTTTSRSTQEFEGIKGVGVAQVPKKQKRKKTKPGSSPNSSSRQSKAAKSKAMCCQREAQPKPFDQL